ncbi:AraC family transcriptional regulator [Pseudomonas resinovorans]|uniref:helix-turn-helix transcriptional regulator n=1 Tax=Metapseudomonas resinovorans TaxID=53412 RepID=UPI00237EEDBD|nr:AraC family transcriptional regulator [Pseudomonas resinovorans]MDE3736916.1 AraC family transcriptional regulator [Pseudomonas resinovorans]
MTGRTLTEAFDIQPSHLAGVLAVEATSQRAFGRHTHDGFGIGVILHGAQDSASGRGNVRAEPGCLISVNPNEVHDGRPVADGPRSWRMLYFDSALIARVAGLLEQSPGCELAHPVLPCSAARQSFLALHAALTGPAEEPWWDVAEQELLQVLGALLEDRRSYRPRLPTGAVARAIQRLDEAPEVAASLTELAREAGVSPHHFLRAFKAVTALPPHAYRLQRQLQKAHRQLLAGEAAVQAALACGFADQSHLNRHFTRAYGYTPGRLARAVRG